MHSKYYLVIIFFTFFFTIACYSQPNFKLQNINIDFNENSIGRSFQLQLQAKTGALLTSVGLRYQEKLPVRYNFGNLFYRKMYPVKLIQHFGPILEISYNYQPKNFYASFFAGYKTEVGIMARRILKLDDIRTRTSTYYHTKSPMVRWDNQFIVGSSMPITPKIKLRVYGGVGVSGLFKVVEENQIFPEAPNGRMHEFSASYGCGLSYQLFGKNILNKG